MRLNADCISEMAAAGLHDAEIAARLNYSSSSVFEFRQRQGIRSGPKCAADCKKIKMAELIGLGYNTQELSAALDVSEATVKRWRARLRSERKKKR